MSNVLNSASPDTPVWNKASQLIKKKTIKSVFDSCSNSAICSKAVRKKEEKARNWFLGLEMQNNSHEHIHNWDFIILVCMER